MCEIVQRPCAHCGHLIVGWSQPGGQRWIGDPPNVGDRKWHVEFWECRMAVEREFGLMTVGE